MGKLRKVNVNFKLLENQKVPFTVIAGGAGQNALDDAGDVYKYAKDIALICLYVKEGEGIKIPEIKYSEIKDSKEFADWKKQIYKMQASLAKWEEVYGKLNTIESKSHVSYIGDDIGSLADTAGRIVRKLKEGKEDYKKVVGIFQEEADDVVTSTVYTGKVIEALLASLEEENQRITTENEMLVSLTKSTTNLTEEQKKQIDKIQQRIDGYKSDRTAAIVGAVTTGVVAGIAIVGGVLLMILLPGVGIPMGVACLFGGGVAVTGTALCSIRAEELKTKMDELTKEMDAVDKEKIGLALIGNQFGEMVKQVNDLKDAVKDIEDNWNGIVATLNNIKKKAEELEKVSAEETDIKIWEAIENDVKSIQVIEESLEEEIKALSKQIKVYSDCNLNECTTKEEIEKKLNEYAASLDVKNDMVS